VSHPVAEPKLIGRYHPDDEINEGVAQDAREGEAASLAVGLAPSPWECECGAAHDRGHFGVIGNHRCLRCGYSGPGGRLMDPSGFIEYRKRADEVNHVS
jgi:hypothetical protein